MKIDPRRDQSYGLESRLQALLHINLLARVTKALKVSENRPLHENSHIEGSEIFHFLAVLHIAEVHAIWSYKK